MSILDVCPSGKIMVNLWSSRKKWQSFAACADCSFLAKDWFLPIQLVGDENDSNPS
jgi:hypothetical protein